MDLNFAIEREWLETNGLGGFASSTIAGLNTRRYHGLLVGATNPPAGRSVLLSKIEETLYIDGQAYELSANQYPGVVHPQGHLSLKEFRLEPFPTFVYEIGDLQLEKRIFLVHGEDTVVIEYHLRVSDFKPLPPCRLELKPLLAFRDYHSTTHENSGLNPELRPGEGSVSIEPYPGLPRLHVHYGPAKLIPQHDWYRNFEYLRERERGLDFREDLFCPFSLEYNLSGPCEIAVVASSQPVERPAAILRSVECKRRQIITDSTPSVHPLVRRLHRAASQYIVRRGDHQSIIAGYHWFADWGRDTMIALPGLTLSTGRTDVTQNVLQTFVAHLDQGMLPNRFPEAGELPEYNTVDATLWMFEAVRAYVEFTDDYAFVREHLYEKLKDVIDWHLRGTRYGIRVDADGLLEAGAPGVQLTWMDAKVGDQVITPRYGKPVEIQALWYNALHILERLALRFDDVSPAIFLRELAARVSSSFNEYFWNADAGCLYDVINGDGRDASMRPNQVFAVSLHYSMLSWDRAIQVVTAVQRDLLTPLGLRTLSPQDLRYRSHYEGGVLSRDSAYHQGTVWPWLMGPFITAYLKVNPENRAQALQWLEAFEAHLDTAGLGHISEIADAELPFTPRGCIAQAWSCAELLRATLETLAYQNVQQHLAA